MIAVDLRNMKLDFSILKQKLKDIKAEKEPGFATHKVDYTAIDKSLKRCKKFKNIIILANGGSRTSFRAFYEALGRFNTKKNVVFLTTMEPDYINNLLKQYKKQDTLVMPISKSGENICPLETMFAFMDKGYTILPVTSDEGTLYEIAKEKGLDHITYPNIGGRYSGRSASAFAPAMFIGVNVKEIDRGARAMYAKCKPTVDIAKNPALQLAAAFYLYEINQGYTEIFNSIYSKKLVGFFPLITQLVHEGCCKQGRGMTVFGGLGPESHHHTIQRFFAGRKNTIGLFVSVLKQQDNTTKIKVPKMFEDIKLRNGMLVDLNNKPYAKALEFEFKATCTASYNNRIPFAAIYIDEVNAYTVGEFLALWQYTAMYYALLLGVDPFDQPGVEESKHISFDMLRNM